VKAERRSLQKMQISIVIFCGKKDARSNTSCKADQKDHLVFATSESLLSSLIGLYKAGYTGLNHVHWIKLVGRRLAGVSPSSFQSDRIKDNKITG